MISALPCGQAKPSVLCMVSPMMFSANSSIYSVAGLASTHDTRTYTLRTWAASERRPEARAASRGSGATELHPAAPRQSCTRTRSCRRLTRLSMRGNGRARTLSSRYPSRSARCPRVGARPVLGASACASAQRDAMHRQQHTAAAQAASRGRPGFCFCFCFCAVHGTVRYGNRSAGMCVRQSRMEMEPSCS